MPIERLRATGSFLREFMEAVPGAVYAKDRAGRILLGNRAFAEAIGCPTGDFLGKDDLELLADKEIARTVMENDQRVIRGQARCQIEETLRSADGSATHWLSTKAPFTDDDGNIVGLIGVSIDITQRKQLEEREKLLAQEIEHRNKNLLSVVQSIVRLTKASSSEQFREIVMGRLEALSRAHEISTYDHRRNLEVRNLLQEELAAYSITTERARLSGPSIFVSADAARPLAMAFHELATNATKYGAFSNSLGTLNVNLRLSQPNGKHLTIEWRETGGPPVEPPSREGFGTRLLRALVEQQLHGELSMMWEPDGFRCLISLPLQSITPR